MLRLPLSSLLPCSSMYSWSCPGSFIGVTKLALNMRNISRSVSGAMFFLFVIGLVILLFFCVMFFLLIFSFVFLVFSSCRARGSLLCRGLLFQDQPRLVLFLSCFLVRNCWVLVLGLCFPRISVLLSRGSLCWLQTILWGVCYCICPRSLSRSLLYLA